MDGVAGGGLLRLGDYELLSEIARGGMGAISDVDAFSKCMTETVLGIDVTEGDSGDCPTNLGAWVVASLQACPIQRQVVRASAYPPTTRMADRPHTRGLAASKPTPNALMCESSPGLTV